MSNNRLMGYLWMVAGLVMPLAILGYIKANPTRMRGVWAAAVCSEPSVICWDLFLVTLPAMVVGAVMLGAGFYLAYPDYGVVE